jgi:hypothetical protein
MLNIGQVLIATSVTIVKNVVATLITKRMLIWALEHAAKQTGTLVDDHAVALIKAGLNNDTAGIEQAAQDLIQLVARVK